jgi:hypothetical protein
MSEQKVKTIDGAPTPIASLNTDAPRMLENSTSGLLARLSKIYRRLNEVMSGMYTGVGCAGTPQQHHSYNEPTKNPVSKGQKDQGNSC